MREYKIVECERGWNIKKRRKGEGKMSLRFLGSHGWILSKTYAKVFYHKDDAESALAIMKIKDGKNAD